MDAGKSSRGNSKLFGKQLRLKKSSTKQSDDLNIRDIGFKLYQERKRVKIDSNQIDLNSLREKSKKVRELKLTNSLDSTKKPNGFEFGDESVLVNNLQRLLGTSRNEKKHAIIRKADLDNLEEIATITFLHKISGSLCVVHVKFTSNVDIIWLSCLWSEWINLKVGDMIILKEIIDLSNIRVCRKWEKVI